MSPLCIAFCICSINDVYGAEHYRAPVEALAPKQIIPEGKKVHSLLFSQSQPVNPHLHNENKLQ